MSAKVKAERVLLPQDFVPKHYDVTITPNLVKFIFEASVDIHVDVQKSVNSVQLHSRELYIQSATFKSEGEKGFSTEATGFNYDTKMQTVTIQFEKEVPLGKGRIHIEYLGEHNNQMAGFYRSSYKDIDGQEKVMVTTQCEAIDARRILPCWDEPAAKATFGVTLVIDSHLTALSNMPERRVEYLKGGKKRVAFMDTPKMSSYLLAMCVGEFEFVQGTTQHGVLMRCYSTPGMVDRARFALDCGVKCLDLYDDYFGIAFPLPKMDMIAIPDFAAGAMENWGLVTYREVDLLVDEASATSAQRQRVCTVVTHELAHQWFGNLVTMAWWDDLWLNEGFACFLQTWAADKLHPEWQLWQQFVTSDLAAALRLDSLRSSHPIQVPIKHAHEVEEVFDAISYCKGACVIRMLNTVIGEAAFQQGLRAYFEAHKYGNTETTDLWKAWADASGMPVADLAKSWTEQMGYPVVKVDIKSETADEVELTCTQSWFLADGSEAKPDEKKTWTLPVVAASASHRDAKVQLVSDETFTLKVPCKSGEWVKVNFGHPVPMRVIYSPDLLKRLSAGVKERTLPTQDRAGLLLDCMALTNAKKLQPELLITLLNAYKGEEECVVWDAIAPALNGLHKALLSDEALSKHLRALAASLVEPAAKKVGWDAKESDGHLTKLLRQTLIALLAKFSDDEQVVAEARRRFKSVLANPADTAACPSDYRTSVYSLALKNGGRTEYEQLIGLFESLNNNADRKQVLHALGFGPTEELKTAALDWTTSGAVKLQDFFYTIASVSTSNRMGQRLAWSYFKKNVDKYRKMIGKANPSLMHAVIVYSTYGNTEEHAAEVEQFFKEHPIPGTDRRVQQVLESIRVAAGFANFLRSSSIANDAFWASL
ncbi:puromycin-sensitive aminopeptidase-like protein [Salpingoeca rosetta]|uniref:Aminopeptidase n=1 Tax=Salpingoeca rosetta (strain ATCC 50818 / BSB-021) TaxID=946362 RepID=F2U3T3_SALR5|nr:puromycin-sensitive aminopeptidase-like protein [Salpingoeca rosetta]EGD82277.1 puromycin-sensitive aminopeptidase-like protein [Salpingoeca rosetta]|eukprot:XP_004996460.1 puromycin-sensitive aminopeptidase-like protein [Salpingoeca rosetta]